VENEETKMKTIGLIGGMSWESSIEYYRIINQATAAELGGLHSAKSIMVSVDFAEIEALQHRNQWEEAGRRLSAAARALEAAGADFFVICTNTMHKVADAVREAVDIPMLHIADATARAVLEQRVGKVALLGTRFTMEERFYRGRLEERYHLKVLIPGAQDREVVHRVIYEELCTGIIRQSSQRAYADIAARLVARGAEGIVLGCTEIGLLLKPENSSAPLFDTTAIHAVTAVRVALGRENL
jgi:aspartate racemase